MPSPSSKTSPPVRNRAGDVPHLAAPDEAVDALLEGVPLAALGIREDGTLWLVSASAARLFGYDRGDLLDQPVERIISPRMQVAWRSIRARIFAQTPRLLVEPETEMWWCRKDGSEFSGRLRLVLLPWATEHRAVLFVRFKPPPSGERVGAADEKLRFLADNVPGWFAYIGGDRRFRFSNTRMAELLGRPREWIVGRHIREVIGEEEYRIIQPRVSAVLSGERIAHDTQSVFMPGRWLRATYEPSFGEGGRVEGYFVLVSDITELKQAETDVRTAEGELRFLADNVPDWFAYTGADQRYRFVNKNMASRLGRPRSEILGRTVAEVLGARVYASVRQHIEAALSGRRVVTEERSVVDPGRWVRIMYEPSFSASGEVEGYFLLASDITELKRTQLELEEAERQVRFVADNVPGRFSYLGADQRYRYVNHGFARAVGVARSEVVGRHVRDVLGEEGYAQIEPSIGAVFKGESISFETPSVVERGRWVRIFLEPSTGPQGEVEGYFVLTFDITEIKHAEEDLKASRAELRALAARLVLAGEEERKRVSRELHDHVSQRLAALGMSLFRLRGELPALPEAAAEMLDSLDERISELAEDTHRISRQLHPAILDDLGLAAALRVELEHLQEEFDVEVSYRSEGLPQGIPGEISLCLFRIAQETLRNISRHSGASAVSVGLGSDGSRVWLRIEDDGIGFEVRAAKGKTGLGLLSMDERVRELGGSLQVASRPGEGTRMEASVPLGGAGMEAE